MTLDWTKLEDAYYEEAVRVIEKFMRQYPYETFYAVAMHESYRETGHVIDLPCLAVNTFEAVDEHKYGQDVKWASPDWRWNTIKIKSRVISQQSKALQDEAVSSTEAHWYRTEKRFIASMVRISKRIYTELKSRRQVSADFVVIFDDQDGGLDLIRKCVPKRLFEKHFAESDTVGVQRVVPPNASPEGRLDVLLKEGLCEKDGDTIAKVGEDVVDLLVAKLRKRDENSYMAAICLGKLRYIDKAVVKVLREEVRKQTAASGWSARALGLHNDFDYLLKLASQDATRIDAVSGILAPLKTKATQYTPLDYGPVERLLATKCRKIAACVAEELAPGSGYADIKPGDAEEAVRGLSSRYLSIRQHAVSVLGDRNLGKSRERGVKKLMMHMILPALMSALEDKHPNVRRLAILSIGRWKRDSRPYKPDVEKRLKDKSAEVRSCAKFVVEGNGFF